MGKVVLPILLIIIPYLLITVCFFGIQPEFSEKYIVDAACLLFLAVIILNIRHTIFLYKKDKSPKSLVFWGMLIKLVHLPFFIIVFVAGMTGLLIIVGTILVPFLILPDIIVLVSSSMYVIIGLLQAEKQDEISSKACGLLIVAQLLFVIDICGAVAIFISIKNKEKEKYFA